MLVLLQRFGSEINIRLPGFCYKVLPSYRSPLRVSHLDSQNRSFYMYLKIRYSVLGLIASKPQVKQINDLS